MVGVCTDIPKPRARVGISSDVSMFGTGPRLTEKSEEYAVVATCTRDRLGGWR
jgi:hypothetical protein